jgi:hypothetical protein
MDDPIPKSEFYSGTGGEVDECSLLLRFFGDGLDPDAITALLGVPPTRSQRKGERKNLLQDTGVWLLECERTTDTADNQIKLLLSDLADDLAVWQRLSDTYSAEIKCHLFLQRWTRGAIFAAETLAELAARKLRLHVEVYARFVPDE